MPLLARCVAGVLLVFTAVSIAAADDDCDFKRSNYLSDFLTERQNLYCNNEIDLTATYLGEAAGNPTGGLSQGIRYAHEIDFGANFDLRKLLDPTGSDAVLEGTKLHVLFAEFAGRSLSDERIGNLFQVQEVFDGAPDVRIATLSLEKDKMVVHHGQDHDVTLDLKVGLVSVGDDFATLGDDDLPLPNPATSFQSGAIAPTPGALLFNSGFTVSPFPSWGGFAKLDFGNFYVQTGAYEVNPTLFEQGNGFKLGLSGATGVLIPAEVGASWKTDAIFDGPGQIRLGGYYDSSNVDNVVASTAGSPPGASGGRWGVYLLGEQTLLPKQNLTFFAGFVVGDSQTAVMQYFFEGGLIYGEPFPGRDQDSINFAVATGWINDRLVHAERNADREDPGSAVVQSAETIIELNYGCQVVNGFMLRPGIQLVINPGADDHVPTAVVFDLQSSIQF